MLSFLAKVLLIGLVPALPLAAYVTGTVVGPPEKSVHDTTAPTDPAPDSPATDQDVRTPSPTHAPVDEVAESASPHPPASPRQTGSRGPESDSPSPSADQRPDRDADTERATEEPTPTPSETASATPEDATTETPEPDDDTSATADSDTSEQPGDDEEGSADEHPADDEDSA